MGSRSRIRTKAFRSAPAAASSSSLLKDDTNRMITSVERAMIVPVGVAQAHTAQEARATR